jgi:hypothetical protein
MNIDNSYYKETQYRLILPGGCQRDKCLSSWPPNIQQIRVLALLSKYSYKQIVPSVKRSHHISPTLRRLHWLPIKQRIDYKIASLTFKTLHFNQPSYLAELLITETPSRFLRSFAQHKLNISCIKFKQSERAFAFAAPTI